MHSRAVSFLLTWTEFGRTFCVYFCPFNLYEFNIVEYVYSYLQNFLGLKNFILFI